jgi:hypothetical protein
MGIGFALFLVIAIPVIIVLARQIRAASDVRDPEGRRLRTGLAGRVGLIVVLLLVLLVSMVGSVRVVPVGHALVIFNTITRSFRLSGQGVTVVWPVISQTASTICGVSSTRCPARKAKAARPTWTTPCGRPRRKGCKSAST